MFSPILDGGVGARCLVLVYLSTLLILFLEQNLWEDILFLAAAISALSFLMTRDW